MKIENASGKIFYGLHFYPGVAEYDDPKSGPSRVFLNENTLRLMDSTFAGKPVFVEHVDGVADSVDELRKEADGWVVESFFNEADGKHWVKFLVVSEKGERAINSGMRLSNAYIPTGETNGGLWNGVSYQKQITQGEYEHLAIVRNPRYEESKIMTPEEFKSYNEHNKKELQRISNSKDKQGEGTMKLNFFKRSKIENELDLASTMVELPKSKKEMTIEAMVNEMDKIVNMHGYASDDHMVKVGENEMSVKELVKKHMDTCNELESMKAPKEEDEAKKENSESLAEDEKTVSDRGGDVNLKNEEDKKKEEAKKNEIAAKAKALKNSGPKFDPAAEPKKIELPQDKLARGRELF